MSRILDVATLEKAAEHYAAEFIRPDRKGRHELFIGGPAYVEQDFQRFTFKDEHEFLVDAIKGWLGEKALVKFEAMARERFAPRDDAVFAALLREKLAVDPDGNHIPGAIGTTNIGSRIVGIRHKLIKTSSWGELLLPKNAYWPVYAGEPEEREAGSSRPDVLPKGAFPWPVDIVNMANVTNISAELGIAALDQVTLRFDEGSTAAEIRGRTGAQPADPDAAETGTLLFTLVMTDPAFPAAVDDADGSVSVTASAIADDVSADATGTLTYCRFAATGTGADDHLDGNATTDGTGATDWNTVAITSGSTVSMTSCIVGLSQGSTAS